MAALLELIDTTVVNVSLPQIMGNLGATLADVGWVVTSYAIANVIILPMSGWLGAVNYGVIVSNDVDKLLGGPQHPVVSG